MKSKKGLIPKILMFGGIALIILLAIVLGIICYHDLNAKNEVIQGTITNIEIISSGGLGSNLHSLVSFNSRERMLFSQSTLP